MPTIYRLLTAYLLITIVVLVSDRSRVLAGILATAPINIPLILWLVWGRSNGEYARMLVVSRSMLTGIASTACFIGVCWLGFSRRWSFGQIMAAGYGVWAAVVFGPALVQRLLARL